jgi:hypothetical protein
MIKMGNNKKAQLEYWVRLFRDDIHYNMHVLETLGELEAKLRETVFYLQNLMLQLPPKAS